MKCMTGTLHKTDTNYYDSLACGKLGILCEVGSNVCLEVG